MIGNFKKPINQDSRIHLILSGVIGIFFNAYLFTSKDFQISLINKFVLGIGVALALIFIVLTTWNLVKIKQLNTFGVLCYIFIFPFSVTLLILENPEHYFLYIYFLGTMFYFLDWEDFRHNDWLIALSIGAAFVVNTITHGFLNLGTGLEKFYFCVICFIIFASYNQYKIAKQTGAQIQRLRFFGGAIAHELRTPLASVIAGAEGLKVNLPKLISAYKKFYQYVDEADRVYPAQAEALLQTGLALERTAREASLLIDMILAKIKNEDGKIEYSLVYNAQSIIEAVLQEYPLEPQEKKIIQFNPAHAFPFKTNCEAIKHVFFNLLKNALYQIKKHKKGNISIWFEETVNYNEIHFKDTAVGIKEEELIKLFEEFYSTTKRGTGIGLPFCRLVVENSNGNIACKSIFNEYTEFILKFPKLN